ncbi:MAG: restriction endonuclease subunit S, partial [Desulfovibrionaceae bacterium]|nr:restriction endonuclease subunit S [Desulfovibrionaceae bacterium]
MRLEKLIQELCPNGVEFKRLEDCCTILDKKRKPVTKAARQAGDYPYYGANGIQDYVSDYIFDGTFILVGEDGSVITKSGTPVVTWAEGKIWVNNHAHIIEEKDNVLLRYLFHYLQTIDVTHLIHGNIPKLTGGDFKALQIPVPPLEVQREIVKILDNFTELTAELT